MRMLRDLATPPNERTPNEERKKKTVAWRERRILLSILPSAVVPVLSESRSALLRIVLHFESCSTDLKSSRTIKIFLCDLSTPRRTGTKI